MVRGDITPIINGVAHDWGSISINIGGVPIIGVTKIEYGEEQEVVNNYGVGQYPVSRGYGQIKPSCKITLLAESAAALEASAPNGRLQNIGTFPVVVAFVPKGGLRTVHVIHNCEFKSNSRSAGTGDTKIEVEYELICSHISWK